MQPAPNLGFLTVVQDNGGYLGGCLVTNGWGRPLEFRLTTTVQPNRIQQLLYAGTLKPYICADLIGKTLAEKVAVPVPLFLTDCEPLLDLRLHIDRPVAWLAAADDPLAHALEQAGAGVRRTETGLLLCHPKHPGDADAIRAVLAKVDLAADLAEPFVRIREALGEARKMGATSRAA